MKKLIKILLVLIGLLLLVQIPFIYRRDPNSKLAEKISSVQGQRQSRTDPLYNEYVGIIHAHTNLGEHSTGTFNELIDAANSNGLDFVMMTEHWSDKYDTSALTLNGAYGKTLFIGGNEIDTADGDRLLMIPGSADAPNLRNSPTAAVLEKLHAENRLALITYPEQFKTWDSAFDGDEIFSLHTAGKQANPFTMFFDMIWSGSSYWELAVAKTFVRPDENLRQFDEVSKRRRITLFAGSDAHSNIGYHLFGDDAGNKIINIKLDRYASVFKYARIHVLLEKGLSVTRENLIDAVRRGHFYTGLDVFGDTSGFGFQAADTAQKLMGDEVAHDPKLSLRVTSPVRARLVLIKNGEKFDEVQDSLEWTLIPNSPGVYRIEVYQDALGESGSRMPWIISNPIYVR